MKMKHAFAASITFGIVVNAKDNLGGFAAGIVSA